LVTLLISGDDSPYILCYNASMEPEQLKAVIERSGWLQLEYVEREGNGNFDGIYAAVLDTRSVLQTPYLVPLKRDFLESKSPQEVAEAVESYVAETQRWGTDTSGI
jgi:hypothetical protein